MADKKKPATKVDEKKSPTVSNRRALHEYSVTKKIVAGMCLQGSEVKSCREGKIQLVDSFATLEKGEVYLHKAHIGEYKQSGPHFNHLPTRKRKLLLRKAEIRKLDNELKVSGTTLIPLKVFFSRGFVKLELAVARGKSKYDKRATLKKKDEKREVDQAMKKGRQ